MLDVLLVLGYSTNPAHPEFRARVEKAADLFGKGVAQQIIMSGCCSYKLERRPEITEAAAMRDYAADLGVPPSAILLEEESVDTLGNFYFSKVRYLEPCSWYHVGVVTTPWHSFRSEYLATMVLGDDYEVTHFPSKDPEGWTEAEIRKSELRNRTLLAETRKQLAGITPGDHEAIRPHLARAPQP